MSKVLRNDRKLLQQTNIVFDGLYALLSKEPEKKSNAKTRSRTRSRTKEPGNRTR